ncbi:MAG: LysR family transcriptional regulator [Myxococcota bacterium]
MSLRDVDLNKLATFFAVAESGGVSGAARRLGLTRSAVSQSLSGLEASLEVQLFHRAGRRLVATREGELLRARLSEYQGQLDRTLRELANEEREARGLVRVGLFLGFSRLHLSRLLHRFLTDHPRTRVRVLYGSREEIRERLLAGRVDFAFSLRPRSPQAARLRSSRLFEQELVLVGTRALLRGRSSLEALAELPTVDYYQGDPLIERWTAHHFPGSTARFSVRAWAATTDLVLELVLQRAGIAVLPRDLVEPQVRGRRLRIVETGRAELRDEVWLDELDPGPYPAPRLAAFRQAVLHEFAQLQAPS